MQILKQQVSTNVPAFPPCDTSVLCKVFGLLLLLFMHPVHSEKQFNYSIGEKLGHPRSDQPSGDASPCLAQRKPKITTFLNNLSYSSMHTSSKGKNSIYQNLTHGPLIPTPHCSPCRAAVQPRMQLPGQELREPTQFQSASWNKEECRNSGKGPITGMGNILKRS